MSEDQEKDLKAILEHGILIAWERSEIERILDSGELSDDSFHEICARHPYALEVAKKCI